MIPHGIDWLEWKALDAFGDASAIVHSHDAVMVNKVPREAAMGTLVIQIGDMSGFLPALKAGNFLSLELHGSFHSS